MTDRPNEAAQKKLALDLFLAAWDQAAAKGCDGTLLAEVAIWLAVADLVDHHGEVSTAEILTSLPERVRRGEFTLGPRPKLS